ncbi:unnamed protein product [Vitrella brassicaformis CCMP3155]|uniref:CWH43-like N-terminal domain-containing protein n=1 Tax=Vitrella brassicaformis (strain CCMP3155) TaxID=1169540 RepID=A0A0G4G7W8_VITBC|nr:unnamed protein product [Vitrella brassicaformis CCMP3155]|eukprot:CEM24593.1 unnamed protein product [Vitrella brassicaformis CCMP3155]
MLYWPRFHPSVSFAGSPERYVAALSLILAGTCWLYFIWGLLTANLPVPPLLKGRVQLTGLMAALGHIGLVGLLVIPVFEEEAVHNAFASVWFVAIMIQTGLMAFLLDAPLLPSVLPSLLPPPSSLERSWRHLRKLIAALMAVCCMLIVVPQQLGVTDDQDLFSMVAISEWVFLLVAVLFMLSCWPYALGFDLMQPFHVNLRGCVSGGGEESGGSSGSRQTGVGSESPSGGG